MFSVKIAIPKDGRPTVIVDEKDMTMGISAVSVHINAGEIPKVTLEMPVDDLEILLADAQVTTKDDIVAIMHKLTSIQSGINDSNFKI